MNMPFIYEECERLLLELTLYLKELHDFNGTHFKVTVKSHKKGVRVTVKQLKK